MWLHPSLAGARAQLAAAPPLHHPLITTTGGTTAGRRLGPRFRVQARSQICRTPAAPGMQPLPSWPGESILGSLGSGGSGPGGDWRARAAGSAVPLFSPQGRRLRLAAARPGL